MKPTTKKHLQQLRDFIDQAGARMLERFKLANACLADEDWLREEHQGDKVKAVEYLQTLAFGDLCAFVGLGTLLAVYAAFPETEDWRRVNFDLRAMIARWETTKPRSKRTCRRATLAELEEALARATRAEEALEAALAELADKTAELTKLRERMAELERDNATMKGEISGLKYEAA